MQEGVFCPIVGVAGRLRKGSVDELRIERRDFGAEVVEFAVDGVGEV